MQDATSRNNQLNTISHSVLVSAYWVGLDWILRDDEGSISSIIAVSASKRKNQRQVFTQEE